METMLKRFAWRPAAIIISLMLAALALTATSASASNNNATGTVVLSDGTRVTAAAAQALSVTPQDNEGAWVSGVGRCNINQARDCWTYINTSTGTPCPASHFCIYTNDRASEGGKVFSFYHCTNGGSEWALQNWTGVGWYNNHNSGGAHAFIKDVNHNTLSGGNIPPYPNSGYNGAFNYRPAWFIRAC